MSRWRVNDSVKDSKTTHLSLWLEVILVIGIIDGAAWRVSLTDGDERNNSLCFPEFYNLVLCIIILLFSCLTTSYHRETTNKPSEVESNKQKISFYLLKLNDSSGPPASGMFFLNLFYLAPDTCKYIKSESWLYDCMIAWQCRLDWKIRYLDGYLVIS